MLGLSYSTIEDIYALAKDEPSERKKLLALATDLEQSGIGYYNHEEFTIRDTRWGREVVSMTDLLSEGEEDE